MEIRNSNKSRMLNISQIPNFIESKIGDIPTIVYIGVGSEFLPRDRESNLDNNEDIGPNVKIWEPNENQQFPLFLQNFKLFNPDVQIIILLIDGVIRKKPLIVQETDRFYSGQWSNPIFPNVFESEHLITVATFRNNIDWHNLSNNIFNPLEILINLIKTIQSNNSLLFYHEFTGLDVSCVENLVIKEMSSTYDRNKICIDISRGQDGDCFPNFSKPLLYPIIEKINGNNELIHLDPRMIDSNQKLRLFQDVKYKNLHIDKNYQINLFDSINIDLILYMQLISFNKIIIEKLCNSVFVIMRQIKYDSSPLPDLSIGTSALKFLSYEFTDIVDMENRIFELINNSNSSNDKMIETKSKIVDECYNIVIYFVKQICLHYSVSEYDVEILVIEMRNTTNLYNLANVYKNFFLSKNII